MENKELRALISFYEENLRKHQETIDKVNNRDDSPTAKMYAESNKRYSEGFKDAIEMVIKDLKEYTEKEK